MSNMQENAHVSQETMEAIGKDLSHQQYCIFLEIYRNPTITLGEIVFNLWAKQDVEEPDYANQTIRVQLNRIKKRLMRYNLTVKAVSSGGGKGNFSKYCIQDLT